MSNGTGEIGSLEWLVNGVVNASLGAMGLLANLLIVVCFIRARRVRTVNCAYLIVSIALTDIIFSGSIVAQSVQNLLQRTRCELAVHCMITQVGAIVATAAGAALLACLATDRYEAACEPYDYQLKDHFKFGVYSFMVSSCFGFLVTVMFTSFGSLLAVLPTTSCAMASQVMQSYWWGFQVTAGVIILVLMVRAWARMSVQVKYAENNGSSTVGAIAKQARITIVVALVVAVTLLTNLLPAIVAFILNMNDSNHYFNRLVLYLGSVAATAGVLRPIVIITRYHSLRSHMGRAFRRHSSNATVGPHMELFAIDSIDQRKSVITLY